MLLKVNVKLPEAAFLPLAPTIEIDVPEEMLVTADAVQVTVQPPE